LWRSWSGSSELLPAEVDVHHAVWLGNIASCHKTLGDIPKATDLLQWALVIDEKLGNFKGEAASVGNLALRRNYR
jgi:hypothetical protein